MQRENSASLNRATSNSETVNNARWKRCKRKHEIWWYMKIMQHQIVQRKSYRMIIVSDDDELF